MAGLDLINKLLSIIIVSSSVLKRSDVYFMKVTFVALKVMTVVCIFLRNFAFLHEKMSLINCNFNRNEMNVIS